jgi:hypothetical protein
MHLSPHDKAIVYNIAMIEQKAAEMLFAMDPSKRTLPDLKVAIEHAEHAQRYVYSTIRSVLDTHLVADYSHLWHLIKELHFPTVKIWRISDANMAKSCCERRQIILLLKKRMRQRCKRK